MALLDSLPYLSAETWGHIFSVLIILFITLVVASSINAIMKRKFNRIMAARRKGKMIKDPTKFAFARRLVIAMIYIVGSAFAIFTIPQLKTVSLSLLGGVGFVAVILGIAAQKAFSNIVAGVFIASSEPYRLGDYITVNETYGNVEDITLRHTILKTWDDNRVIIPNSKMDEAYIINHSIEDEHILATLDMGISYDSDIDKAKKLMADAAIKHPKFRHIEKDYDYLTPDEKVKIRVTSLGDFAVNLRMYFWADNKPESFKMSCDLREIIKKRFDNEGIEIPFPYRTIVYKKDIKKR